MTQAQKVLIVDDEAPVRAVLSRWLTRWGYGHIREVGSALEALDAMNADPADILLCDVNMPEHDGLWLVEQVQVCWPQTAIVMSTGLNDPTTIRTSRLRGAVAYVTKPFDPHLLEQALERATGQLHVRPSAQQAPAGPSSGTSRVGPDGAMENPLEMGEVLKRADEQLPRGDARGPKGRT